MLIIEFLQFILSFFSSFMLLFSKILKYLNIFIVLINTFKGGGCITPIFSRDIYKFVAIAILCYIILFYCINLLFQFLN